MSLSIIFAFLALYVPLRIYLELWKKCKTQSVFLFVQANFFLAIDFLFSYKPRDITASSGATTVAQIQSD